MRRFRSKDVETTTLERCLPWLLGFLLCAVIVLGNVRLYELKLDNEGKQQQVTAMTEEVGSLKKQKAAAERKLEQRAKAMGYGQIAPEEIIVVHVGREPEAQREAP